MLPQAPSLGAGQPRYYAARPSVQSRADSLSPNTSTAVSFMTNSTGGRNPILSPPLSLYDVSSNGVSANCRGNHIKQHTTGQVLRVHKAPERGVQTTFDTWVSNRQETLPSSDQLTRQKSTSVPMAYREATKHCESKSGFGKLVDQACHPRKWRKYKEGQRVISKRTMRTHDDDRLPRTTTADHFVYQIPAFHSRSTITDPESESPYLTVKEALEREAIKRDEEAKAKSTRLTKRTRRLYKSLETEKRDIGHVTGSLCSQVTHRLRELWKISAGRKLGAGSERVRLRKAPRRRRIISDASSSTPGDHASASALRAQPSHEIRRTSQNASSRHNPIRAPTHSPDDPYRSASQSVDTREETTPSDEHLALRAHQDVPLSPISHLSHASTTTDYRDRTADWTHVMNNNIWDKTPHYASTLSSESRASNWAGGSDTSSISDEVGEPSPYEFEVASREEGGLSRRGTTYSGSTAVSSRHNRMSSDLRRSKRGSRNNGKPPMYAPTIRKSPSEYSLDSAGKTSKATERFTILKTSLPWQNQDREMRSMVAA
jgi:hypothetical protein